MKLSITPYVKILYNEKVDRNRFIYETYVNFNGTKEEAVEVIRERYPNPKTGKPMSRRRIFQIVAHYKNKFVKGGK